jgi:ribosomal-protein-alanine N-acetyltransferase
VIAVGHHAFVGLELRGAIVLRSFRVTDREDFIALVHDEAMFEYTKFRLDEATVADYFDYLRYEPDAWRRHLWNLVVESPDGEFAGWAGVDGRGGDSEAEIGWYLASRHWVRGYATEATRLLIDYAFGTLGYRRLFATADPDNAASRRVLEKSGLTLVGAVDDVETWRGSRRRVMYELVDDRP